MVAARRSGPRNQRRVATRGHGEPPPGGDRFCFVIFVNDEGVNVKAFDRFRGQWRALNSRWFKTFPEATQSMQALLLAAINGTAVAAVKRFGKSK